MKQLIKTGWLLITPPSTTDFLGIVSLNLASLLPAVFVRLHVGDLPSTGLGDGPLALVIPLGWEWFLKTIYEYQIKVSRVKFCSKGREPWSSSYGKRLTFRRLWVRIPAQYACCKDCTVCLKRPKINKKSPGMGHFKKSFVTSAQRRRIKEEEDLLAVPLNSSVYLDCLHEILARKITLLETFYYRSFFRSFFPSFSTLAIWSFFLFYSLLFPHSYFIPFLSPYWLPISVILVHPTNPSLFKVLFSSRKASAVIVIELSCQHNGLRSRPTILQPVGSNPSTGTKVPEVAQLCVTFTRCKLQ